MGRGTHQNGTLVGETGVEGVPLALDSARRRLRRARASARLVSARRRCSGESEEGELEEEREAFAGAAGAPARRRLAGGAKKSAMVLGAVGVGGDGAIGSGFGEILVAAAEGRFCSAAGDFGGSFEGGGNGRASRGGREREEERRRQGHKHGGVELARAAVWNWRAADAFARIGSISP